MTGRPCSYNVRRAMHWSVTAITELQRFRKWSGAMLGDRAGYSADTARRMRGGATPSIATVENMLNAMGYELCFRPMKGTVHVHGEITESIGRLVIDGDVRQYEAECDQHMSDMGHRPLRIAQGDVIDRTRDGIGGRQCVP